MLSCSKFETCVEVSGKGPTWISLGPSPTSEVNRAFPTAAGVIGSLSCRYHCLCYCCLRHCCRCRGRRSLCKVQTGLWPGFDAGARRVVVLGTPASGDCRRPQSAEAAIAIQAIRRLFHILASMHDVYKDKYTLQSKQIHFAI